MSNQDNNTMKVGMIFISMIFFIFGFVTTFIITLSEPVMEAFNLTYTQAFLVNSAFFISYAFFSIPAGTVIKKIGYKNAIVLGLSLIAVAGFLFFPAIGVESYTFFLGAIVVLSLGVVLLQTAANPYVTELGPAETASGRLNLTQSLNSIATWLAPLLIVALIIPAAAAVEADVLDDIASAVTPGDLLLPFLIIGAVTLIIAIAVALIKLPSMSQEGLGNFSSTFKYRHMLLGALGIFCYVGAEVGVGTAIASYVVRPDLGGGISREMAFQFVALYWAGAMIGRLFGAISLSDIKNKQVKMLMVVGVLLWAFFVGFYTLDWSFSLGVVFFGFAVLNYILMQLGSGNANRVLAIFAGMAILMSIISVSTSGMVSVWTIVSIGLFNSVMFPNIFSLAVKGLDRSEVSLASGIINTLIVGGAVIPPLMGLIADTVNIQASFLVPIACYAYIMFFALVGSKIKPAEGAAATIADAEAAPPTTGTGADPSHKEAE
ncbi:MFS transporter [Balneolaceae bacterium ANBcel3]|nr:MFS transporter [Balneolaceae bacterium ANBcel3]